jgi:hypothetical protein
MIYNVYVYQGGTHAGVEMGQQPGRSAAYGRC